MTRLTGCFDWNSIHTIFQSLSTFFLDFLPSLFAFEFYLISMKCLAIHSDLLWNYNNKNNIKTMTINFPLFHFNLCLLVLFLAINDNAYFYFYSSSVAFSFTRSLLPSIASMCFQLTLFYLEEFRGFYQSVWGVKRAWNRWKRERIIANNQLLALQVPTGTFNPLSLHSSLLTLYYSFYLFINFLFFKQFSSCYFSSSVRFAFSQRIIRSNGVNVPNACQ